MSSAGFILICTFSTTSSSLVLYSGLAITLKSRVVPRPKTLDRPLMSACWCFFTSSFVDFIHLAATPVRLLSADSVLMLLVLFSGIHCDSIRLPALSSPMSRMSTSPDVPAW